ncbi:hypothetical protein D3C71_1950110 [compost metagenome]
MNEAAQNQHVHHVKHRNEQQHNIRILHVQIAAQPQVIRGQTTVEQGREVQEERQRVSVLHFLAV